MTDRDLLRHRVFTYLEILGCIERERRFLVGATWRCVVPVAVCVWIAFAVCSEISNHWLGAALGTLNLYSASTLVFSRWSDWWGWRETRKQYRAMLDGCLKEY